MNKKDYKPTKEEKELGVYLQSLFNFKTEVSYLNIGNTGTIYCIRAKNEFMPYVIISGSNSGREENSIKLLEYARKNFPKWFDAGNGFYIYYEDAVDFRNKN